MSVYRSKIDVNKLPDDLRDACLLIAERHNALVEDTQLVQHEVSQITGDTPEEKAETYRLLGQMKRVFRLIHSQRFNVLMISVQAYVFSKLLGVTSTVVLDPKAALEIMQTVLNAIQQYQQNG